MKKGYFWGMAIFLTLVGISVWRGIEEFRQNQRVEDAKKEIQRLKEAIATSSKGEAETTKALADLRQQCLDLDEKASEKQRQQELMQLVGNRGLDRKDRQEAQRELDAIRGKIASRREKKRALEVSIQVHETSLKATKEFRETNEEELRGLMESK